MLVAVVGLLLALLFVRSVTPDSGEEPLRQSSAINLALRRTAHHLLRGAGDSTSRIPAVEQPNAYTYRLRLGRAFEYGKLPALLQQSLELHRIAAPYTVAVLDCNTRTLQLGYSVRDLKDAESVPCAGRSMAAGCYVLQVTFADQAGTPTTYWPVLAVVGLVIGLMVMTWRRPVAPTISAMPPANRLHFGRSWLDVTSQVLNAGPTQHNLTYRETKLLRLLASHPNEILERNRILEQVWEDEGVIVSRSVDVFISRLRKLLSSDETVRIVAIHGVGYRLEVLAAAV